MLAGPAYVEWTDAQVLLQRHKNCPGPGPPKHRYFFELLHVFDILRWSVEAA